ncbi:fimbrial protein [Herbaspirillum sp. alder98]|uniref:fimbrial protein n=1 Tax=Herbaspirillum sp. alder98 TaxID=2913096 RepID=UPI001CD8954D|nr:fimbrial protein [Herbaspirillum sp. alder98]MCA1324715.1 fimbrial protein [Herbaspirillum sp. alder98]
MKSFLDRPGNKRLLLAGFVFVLASGVAEVAVGACRVVNSPDGKEQAVHIDYVFPAQIVVPRNVQVGGVIARAPISMIRRTGQSMLCDGGSSVVSTGSGASDADVDRSYGYLLTNGIRNGVAYRLLKRGGDGVILTDSNIFHAPSEGIYWGFATHIARENFSQLVLVKTGHPIRAGTVFSAGEKFLVKVTAFSGDRRPFTIATLRSSNRTTILAQTCQISVPSAVRLGEHRLSTFNRVGSTSRATSFDMSVFCEGVASKVYMTMSDPVSVGNTSDQLSLTNDSTAAGIKVQILRDGQPVGLGPDSTSPGTINQFKLFDASESYPTHVQRFEARYIQSEQDVTAGTAHSRVTIAMSYQ